MCSFFHFSIFVLKSEYFFHPSWFYKICQKSKKSLKFVLIYNIIPTYIDEMLRGCVVSGGRGVSGRVAAAGHHRALRGLLVRWTSGFKLYANILQQTR